MKRIQNYQNTVAVTQNARYQGNPYETRVIHIDNVDTQGGVPLETANEYVLQRLATKLKAPLGSSRTGKAYDILNKQAELNKEVE